MNRSLALFVALAAALVALGALADRALTREAAASAALAAARAENDARTAALSVRGALGQIEQALLAGAAPAAVSRQSLALAPAPAFGSGRPYRGRPASELMGLLMSTESTPWGLPEAVVAAAVLGRPGSQHTVAERLLSGQLPVRADDVPHLAKVLGAADDPRVAALQAALRGVPEDLLPAPAFRRARRGAAIEGWTRHDRASLRYEVPVSQLFESAGVADRAVLSAGGIPVPDVPGFALALGAPVVPPPTAGRVLVWTAVAACLAALALVQRSLAREAQAISREKAFVAGVTHELRTPVAAIRVFGEALAEGAGDPREYGTLVAEESERLEALVERVLAATRMDEAPRFATVRPAELLVSAVGLMRPRAERRGVTLRVRAEDDVGDARWDGDAVRRALLNLIDNAIKHGRPAGAVEAGARAEGEHVRLWVRDDGPGITRRDRERVFGRFERGTTEASGTGLGLYLVDQVVRAHGGRIHLATGEGQGCTFDLLLPRQPTA
jgi:signal transduction histidine kinase